MEPAIARLHPSDRELMREGVRALERPSRLIEMLNSVAGRPVEALIKRGPDCAARTLDRALCRALNRAIHWAVATIEQPQPRRAQPELGTPLSHARVSALAHTTAAALLGGVSGAFEIALELPVTTTVMLRSLASIAPEIADLLARIGARFGYAVTDIASAQLVPVVGAFGGAAINAYFTNYFNRIALYHFGIRKLDRLYGGQAIEAAYREELALLPR